MKNTLLCSLLAVTGLVLAGCGDDGRSDPQACVDPTPTTLYCPITTDRTLLADSTYTLSGQVFVTDGATLTIEEGVEIRGNLGAALIVTRDGTINAIGTSSKPVVMTCNLAPGDRTDGCWAGLALLGNATINDGACLAGTSGDDCPKEYPIEGIDSTDSRGLYGGADDTSSCGTLEYVRIEFAGSELSPNNELNGLTVGACGDSTTISHLQVHRGKDDGIEFFGGTAGMDHVVISGARDDSLDWDEGWRGEVQFIVIHQFAGIGDNGIESDNLGANMDALPRSAPTLWNATLCGVNGDGTRGARHREGTAGAIQNAIVQNFTGEAMDVNDDATVGQWPTNLSWANTFYWSNAASGTTSDFSSDNTTMFVLADAIMLPALNNVFDANPGVDCNDTAPNYVPTAADSAMLAGQAVPGAGFEASATYAGAFEPGGTDWTAGWTAYPVN